MLAAATGCGDRFSIKSSICAGERTKARDDDADVVDDADAEDKSNSCSSCRIIDLATAVSNGAMRSVNLNKALASVVGMISGRVDMACPNLTKVGPRLSKAMQTRSALLILVALSLLLLLHPTAAFLVLPAARRILLLVLLGLVKDQNSSQSSAVTGMRPPICHKKDCTSGKATSVSIIHATSFPRSMAITASFCCCCGCWSSAPGDDELILLKLVSTVSEIVASTGRNVVKVTS